MGVAGHLGLAFDPADEATAIAALNGKHDGAEWVRYHTDFGLDEIAGDFYRVLEALAKMDSSLAPLATLTNFDRKVGEGPKTYFFLYRPDEILVIAAAFASVTDTLLEQAIAEARSELGNAWFPENLPQAFWQVAGEVQKVADNGWSMIDFLI